MNVDEGISAQYVPDTCQQENTQPDRKHPVICSKKVNDN